MNFENIFVSIAYVLFALLPGLITLNFSRAKTGFWVWSTTSLILTMVAFTFVARIFQEPITSYAVSLLLVFGCTKLHDHFSLLKKFSSEHDDNIADPQSRNRIKTLISTWPLILFFCTLFSLLITLRVQFSQLYFDPNRFGAEKLFNLQFMNSFVHGQGYPPESLWFSGTPVGYYLLPKVLPGVFLKIISLVSQQSHFMGAIFHISDCFWISLSSTLLAELAVSFFRSKPTPLHFAFGSLIGLFPLLTGPLRALQQTYDPLAKLDLWSLSRIVENTVNEYPFWNFIWSDNHSHSNVMPFQLVFFYWFVSFIKGISASAVNPHPAQVKTASFDTLWTSLIFCAFSACAIAMSHSGSVFIDISICLPIILCFAVWHFRNKSFSFYLNSLSLLAIFTGLLFVPDFLTRPQPNVKWYFVPHSLRTSLYELFQIYFSHLLFLAASLVLGIFLAIQKNWLLKVTDLKSSLSQNSNILLFSLVLALFFIFATPEFIASNWDMGEKYMRYNTLFRFLFESYYWLPLIGSFMIVHFVRHSSHLTRTISVACVALACLYAAFVPAQAKTFLLRSKSVDQNIKALDGLKWFEVEHQHDAGIISFLRSLQNEQIVLAEACGMPPNATAYTTHGRVSALSGWPALCGWGQHVFLFQKPSLSQADSHVPKLPKQNTWEQLLDRQKWITELYSSRPLKNETQKSLMALGVTHLIFGELEKKEFPQQTLDFLKSRGNIIYEKDGYGVVKLAFSPGQP
jgi:uncharacterized membrane protein